MEQNGQILEKVISWCLIQRILFCEWFQESIWIFFNSFQGIFPLIENGMTYIRNIDLNCSALQSECRFHTPYLTFFSQYLPNDRLRVWDTLFHKGVNQKRKEAKSKAKVTELINGLIRIWIQIIWLHRFPIHRVASPTWS